MKKLIFALVLFLVSTQAWAAPPSPEISHVIHGTNLLVNWTEVPEATEYTLYYAPYPYKGPDTIESMGMGPETHFSIYLWNGATYYIAVTAKNASGESAFSNINVFHINVPATLVDLTITGDTFVGENDTLQLTATATWDDGATTDVTTSTTWSEQSSAVDSVSDGLVTAGEVSSDTEATINARYIHEGVTLEDSYLITVQETPPFTDNRNGTVTDNTTDLVWQKTDDNVSRSWQLAVDYCEDLTLGRSSNWRLPSKDELSSLVESNQYPTISNKEFPGTNASNYWSSTSIAHLPYYALNVNFKNGNVYNYYKTNYYYVRCVR